MELSLFLGKVMGIYSVVIAILWLAYARELQEAWEEFMQSKMLYYIVAEAVFLIGLLLVVSHTRFTNDPVTILVTLISYGIFLKGLLLLLLPHDWLNVVIEIINRRVVYVIGGILALLLGATLLFFSFIWPLVEQLP